MEKRNPLNKILKIDPKSIDRNEVKKEWSEKNLLQAQRELFRVRRTRIFTLSILLAALILTIIYGTLENPFEYTLSNIGNLFNYRIFFVIWSIITGTTIQVAILSLFHLEKYAIKRQRIIALISTFLLIITAVVPALQEQYPFWHFVHGAFAVLYALSVFIGFNPFVLWVSAENPRLRIILQIWLMVIWVGGILALILLGRSGIFEMWFFVTLIIFLLYLSLMLFEEDIVKRSITFFNADPTDLNETVDKVYINLDKK